MKRAIIVILTAIVIAVSLAACGGGAINDVKNTAIKYAFEDTGKTYGEVLDTYCSNVKWRTFTGNSAVPVIEFAGTAPNGQKVVIQWIQGATYDIAYAWTLDGVEQDLIKDFKAWIMLAAGGSSESVSETPQTATAAPEQSAPTESAGLENVVYKCDEYYITRTEFLSAGLSVSQDEPRFNDGLLRVKDGAGKFGFVNESGNLVIACTYENAEPFSGGLAAVKAYDEWTGKYNWGFINTAGALVIPCEYEEVHNFSEGLAAVKKLDSQEWGYIDATGAVVIPFEFGYYQAGYGLVTRDFHEGLAYTGFSVSDKERSFGFIDTMGSRIITYESLTSQDIYFNRIGDFSGELALGNDYGHGDVAFYVDKSGVIVRPKSEVPYLSKLNSFNEGLAVITNSSGGRVIDKSGNTVFSLNGRDMTFASTQFSEGLIAVQSTNSKKFGYIDTSGEVAIPFNIEYAGFDDNDFSCGIAKVGTASNMFYINRQGENVFAVSGILWKFYDDVAITYDNGTKKYYLLRIVRNGSTDTPKSAETGLTPFSIREGYSTDVASLPAIITEKEVVSVETGSDAGIGNYVKLTFNESGKSAFAEATGRLAGNGTMSVWIGETIMMNPSVGGQIVNGEVLLMCDTKEQADYIAKQIRNAAGLQ